MWELAGIAITSLNIYYADLPTTAGSYDDVERNVEQFYDQKIPNVILGGHYIIDDNDWLSWNINTGTHTDKLNTGTIGIGYNHNFKINDNSNILFSVSNTYSLTKHKPCVDSFNKEYYCGNLTAWSDLESKKDENNIQTISINYTRTW